MRWGVPLLGDRVAPRCTCADGLLLASVNRGRVVSHSRVSIGIGSFVELMAALTSHGVDNLACGGISREVREALAAQAVGVIDNVACSADEVVAALESGSLCPGYGFTRHAAGASQRAESPGEFDCLACQDRVCLVGLACQRLPGRIPTPMPKELGRLLEAAADIAHEDERTLCRLAELVYLCLEMGYRRVGLAFCVDLLEPTRILVGVLRRFFEVVPVWCRVGRAAEGSTEPALCNPFVQAQALNDAQTDINVLVGLCVGADCVFNQLSQAPVTTLFVKDKSLANNPIAALYSEHYLRESSNPTPGLGKTSGERAWSDAHSTSHPGPSQREKHP